VGAREFLLPAPNCNTTVKDLTHKDLLTSTFTLASHERGKSNWQGKDGRTVQRITTNIVWSS
jgi:hypothetical protein